MALKERIGNPDLFCGREKEMRRLLTWTSGIPKELSKSMAMLGRRKTGKTAIMQRLFNILWNQNDQVIPFYFEVQDHNICLLHFAEKYYCVFLSHFFSFVLRKTLPLNNIHWEWEELVDMAKQYGNKDVINNMNVFQKYIDNDKAEFAKDLAFGAPAGFVGYTGKFFVVMIDEIQYMTEYIFDDKEKTIKAYNLPGAFHGLVELKIAPMLVAGSYIGWMTQMMRKMFVGSRLKPFYISPKLDDKGGLEAVYKYAQFYDIALTDEVASIINLIIQSDPYYMTVLFSSYFRDFSSVEGAIQTFVEEISDKEGELYLIWMEYIDISLNKVNDKYGKQILLILSKNRHNEMARDEILDQLGWPEERDRELEEKLQALVYGGLIEGTASSYHYKGIPDDILDLIFRSRYQYEIYREKVDMKLELQKKVKALEKDNRSLKGLVSDLKGRMLELVIWRELNSYRKKGCAIPNLANRFRPVSQELKNHPILSVIQNMTVGLIYLNYYIQSPETSVLELDILVESVEYSSNDCYHAIVFEIKNRDEKNCPTDQEIKLFAQKIEYFKHALKRQGKTDINIFPIYLSANGFDEKTEQWLHAHHIFTADMASWGDL
jgi:hypothetical protein